MPQPRTPLSSLPLWRLVALGALFVAALGCSPGLYDLPQPPAKSEWRDVSLVPGEEERNSQANYLRARATALRLYDALSSERWKEAWSLLSLETQASLERGSAGQGGISVLRDGLYEVPSGTTPGSGESELYSFDPIDHLIVRNIVTFKDEMPDEEEEETARRKEIYAISQSGQSKKVVLIFEDDAWRIHKTNFDNTELTLAGDE